MFYLNTIAAAISAMWFLTVSCSIDNNENAATDPVQVTSGSATAPVSVRIDTIRPFREADGYTHIEATMHGNVDRDDGSTGNYAVPMILIYPDDGGNGIGVVDWLITIDLHQGGFKASPGEWTPGRFALRTTDGYLFENGYTYATVQWDKGVTDHFGPAAPDGGEQHSHLIYGAIEEAEDAFTILRDVAHFLRDPGSLEGDDGPVPVDAVLSFGFSHSGTLQMEYMSSGKNLSDGELVYDGHLVGKAGLLCWTFHNELPGFADLEPCYETPVDDGAKVIHIAAQGDVEAVLYAGRSRFPDNPNWRQYELAGVSHLPVAIGRLNENQNPASSNPVFRAAFHNLTRWVTEDVPAPPSRFLEGTLNQDGTFDTDLDEDGNALGGLRLPHMEQIVDGTVAGAPLGRYTGKHPEGGPDQLFWFGGYFEPFTNEELAERYSDYETYVQRVTRAADYILEKGYILKEDRDVYLEKAAIYTARTN